MNKLKYQQCYGCTVGMSLNWLSGEAESVSQILLENDGRPLRPAETGRNWGVTEM